MHLRYFKSKTIYWLGFKKLNVQGVSPIQYTVASPQQVTGALGSDAGSTSSSVTSFARQNVRVRKFLPDVIRNLES